MQSVSDVEEGAEQGGTIVVQQLEETCLVDEAAEFDEVACALAPLVRPITCV